MSDTDAVPDTRPLLVQLEDAKKETATWAGKAAALETKLALAPSQAKFEEQTARIQSLEASLKTVRQEKDDLDLELSRERRMSDKTETLYADAKADIKNLRAKIVELEKELTSQPNPPSSAPPPQAQPTPSTSTTLDVNPSGPLGYNSTPQSRMAALKVLQTYNDNNPLPVLTPAQIKDLNPKYYKRGYKDKAKGIQEPLSYQLASRLLEIDINLNPTEIRLWSNNVVIQALDLKDKFSNQGDAVELVTGYMMRFWEVLTLSKNDYMAYGWTELVFDNLVRKFTRQTTVLKATVKPRASTAAPRFKDEGPSSRKSGLSPDAFPTEDEIEVPRGGGDDDDDEDDDEDDDDIIRLIDPSPLDVASLAPGTGSLSPRKAITRTTRAQLMDDQRHREASVGESEPTAEKGKGKGKGKARAADFPLPKTKKGKKSHDTEIERPVWGTPEDGVLDQSQMPESESSTAAFLRSISDQQNYRPAHKHQHRSPMGQQHEQTNPFFVGPGSPGQGGGQSTSAPVPLTRNMLPPPPSFASSAPPSSQSPAVSLATLDSEANTAANQIAWFGNLRDHVEKRIGPFKATSGEDDLEPLPSSSSPTSSPKGKRLRIEAAANGGSTGTRRSSRTRSTTTKPTYQPAPSVSPSDAADPERAARLLEKKKKREHAKRVADFIERAEMDTERVWSTDELVNYNRFILYGSRPALDEVGVDGWASSCWPATMGEPWNPGDLTVRERIEKLATVRALLTELSPKYMPRTVIEVDDDEEDVEGGGLDEEQEGDDHE